MCSIGGDRHGADGGAHVVAAVVGELVADVPPLQDLEGLGVDDLEDALAFARVAHDPELAAVGRRVDPSDAGVVDPGRIGGVGVLVRRVARREAAGLLTRGHVDAVDDVRRGVRHQHLRAVRGDGHVVRAVAVHREAPADLARLEADGDDVREARPRDVDLGPFRVGEHVVDELVVPLADGFADGEEVGEPVGARLDLGHPLLAVRDDVDLGQDLERAAVDDGRGALPVVADEHHRAGVGALRWCLAGGHGRGRHAGEERRGGQQGDEPTWGHGDLRGPRG